GRAGRAPRWGAFSWGRQGTILPVGGGARARRFCWEQECNFSGTRPLTRAFRAGARKAQCEGVLLFGYFLLHKQEKVTRSPQASGSLRSQVTRAAQRHGSTTLLKVPRSPQASGSLRSRVSPSPNTSEATAQRERQIPAFAAM